MRRKQPSSLETSRPNLKLTLIECGCLILGLFILTAIIWTGWSNIFLVGDGLARFMPPSVVGSRAVLSGHLPLINYFQFRAQPLLETGYYPVLYPVLWISYAFAHYILRSDQNTWNILCTIQIFLNGLAIYLLCRFTLFMARETAIASGFVVATLGFSLFHSGDSFYVLVTPCFVALLVFLLERALSKNDYRFSVLAGLVLALFFYASNFQFVLYGLLSALLLFLAAIIAHPSHTVRLFGFNAFKHLLAFILIFTLSCFPYLFSVGEYLETTKQNLDTNSINKFFALKTTWQELLKGIALPFGLEDFNEDALPQAIYAIGILPCFGILLYPFVIWESLLRGTNKESFHVAFLLLCAGALLFIFLFLGKAEILGDFIQQVEPQHWFKYSIKWGLSYQLILAVLGMWTLDRFLLAYKVQSRFCLLSISLIAFANGAYACIQFPAIERLTEVNSIVAPPLIASPEYRVAALWDKGAIYSGQEPGTILGYNLASLYSISSFSGYEPLLTFENLDTAEQFFPGYYTNLDKFPIQKLMDHSVRFLLVPKYLLDPTLLALNTKFPSISFSAAKSLGTDQTGVILIRGVSPIIKGADIEIKSFNISAYDVSAQIKANAPTSAIIDLPYNDAFKVTVNGKKAKTDQYDKFSAITVAIKTPGTYKLRIQYSPSFVLPMILGWVLSLLALACSLFSYKN